MFDRAAWPGDRLWPILRRTVHVFGPEHIMWASDFSVNQRGESWADLLYGMLGFPVLSRPEKEWVPGKSLRSQADWTAS
jgi:L-fuconolactonase